MMDKVVGLLHYLIPDNRLYKLQIVFRNFLSTILIELFLCMNMNQYRNEGRHNQHDVA